MAAAPAAVADVSESLPICCHPDNPRFRAQACNVALVEHDPEMADIIEREKTRQFLGLELIASEVRQQFKQAQLQFTDPCHRISLLKLSWNALDQI